MATRILTTVLLAGAALAVVMAPNAGAASGAGCDNDGPAAVCTRNGHAAIYATPNNSDQWFTVAPGGGNPFGAGAMPPLLAID